MSDFLLGDKAMREFHRIAWRRSVLQHPDGPAFLAKFAKMREQDVSEERLSVQWSMVKRS